jgi:four helix bundle protein
MSDNTESFEHIENFRDLRVYQNALDLSEDLFTTSKDFPDHEQFDLVSQIKRSSRSVCANLAEAWHKRVYKDAFLAKLNDAVSEAAETQVWLDVALSSNYITTEEFEHFDDRCEKVIAQILKMESQPERWVRDHNE